MNEGRLPNPAQPPNRRIRSTLREFILIVAGVLLALWVNAFANARADRRRERVDLEQLLAVTRENESRAVQAAAEDSVAVTSARGLLALKPTDNVSRDSLLSLLNLSVWYADFHAVTGLYNGLSQAGELNLIRNAKLRGDIYMIAGELAGHVEQLRDIEQQILVVATDIIPKTSSYFSELEASPKADAAKARLLTDREVREALLRAAFLERNHFDSFDQLRKSLRTLRQDLEAELHVKPQEPRKAKPLSF